MPLTNSNQKRMGQLNILIPNISPHFDDIPDLANVITPDCLQYEDTDLINLEIPVEQQRLELAKKEAQKLINWIKIAKPGTFRIYHTGNLMAERETNKFADLAGKIMFYAAEKRLVMLMQRSSQIPDEKEYLAYRSEKGCKPEREYQLKMIIHQYGVKNEQETNSNVTTNSSSETSGT